MKVSASTFDNVNPELTTRSYFSVMADLLKARLTFLVLLTAWVGFVMGADKPFPWVLMLHAMLGIGLVAGGAAALNQYLEREWDSKMPRTQGRPIPSQTMSPETALLWGAGMTAAGLLYLAIQVNPLTSLLGALTSGSYLLIYTPLKRRTTLNTVIGAIPGAVPPLMGWTAATGEVSLKGWSLFAILFFWQLPHFLAIAWLYRDQYAQAGFKMLPLEDESGVQTGRQALSHTLGLLPISLSPVVLGMGHAIYFVGATLLGAWFLYRAWRFGKEMSEGSARKLFFASIIYLPLLLGLLITDRMIH